VVFVKNVAEVVVGAFQTPDNFAMLGKFSQNWMMQVHGESLRNEFV